MSDRQVAGPERGEDLAVADDIALDVLGEDQGQAAVDGEGDVAPHPRASASRWARYFA
ncbi:hypothetical protein ACFO9E_21995 [Streptomyces maoxianensis]|uniref:Uncharacterized protein n=1 Tax=Streptomyces maoxianensis TaxID=1459942 RepID=A0ABV9GCU7_9ACTN